MALVVRTRIVAAAAAALAVAACEPARPPAVTFEPEARALAGGEGRDPSLHVASSGAVSLLFAATSDRPGYEVVLGGSPDGGDSFPERRSLASGADAHGESSPLYLVDRRERRYALWVAKGQIHLSRSLDFGRSFTDPVPIETGGHLAFFSAALAPDDTLVVAWLDYAPVEGAIPGTASLRVVSSADGGETWSAPAHVAANVCPCCRPAIAARPDDGRWFVSWRSTDAENIRDLALAHSDDRGRTWSPPALVSNDGWKIAGCPHSGPSLAVHDGEVHVAWTSAAGGEPRVYASRTADGEAFAPRAEISRGLLDANHPRLAVAGGRLFAAFQARDAAEREGFARSRIWLADLTTGGAPVAAPAGDGSAVYPALHPAGANRIVVAWTEVTDDGVRVRLARARVGGDAS